MNIFLDPPLCATNGSSTQSKASIILGNSRVQDNSRSTKNKRHQERFTQNGAQLGRSRSNSCWQLIDHNVGVWPSDWVRVESRSRTLYSNMQIA